MLSRSQAVKLLRQHGFQPNDPTEYTKDANGLFIYDEESSFDSRLGIKESYSRQDVLAWLGY